MTSDLYISVEAFFSVINYDVVVEIFNKGTTTFCLNLNLVIV
jgi:hypothetical protein